MITQGFLNDFHTATVFEMYAIIIGFTLVGMGICLAIIGLTKADMNDHYKQGQIDALNGKIKYHLTKNKDGESNWTEIKN